MSDAMPHDWERTSLGELLTLEYGRSLPESSRISGNVPVYGSNGVVGFHSVPLVADRGIVIGRKGTAGSVHVTDGAFWPIDTTYFVQPRRNMEFDWLSATLDHANLRALSEATGVPGLNREKAYRQPVLLPPLDEQRRIAEVLRSVDDTLLRYGEVAISLRRAKAAVIEEFMSEASSGRVVRLADVTECMDSGWSPDCENVAADIGEWAVLKTSAVTWDGYDDHQNKRLPANLQPRPAIAVQSGDILITRAGPAERTGVVAMVDSTNGRRMLSDKLIRIRVKSSCADSLAIAEILGSNIVQEEINRAKSGMAASQTNITQKTLANLEIPLPKLEVQRIFASSMCSFNELIKLNTAQIDRLSQLKSHIASDLLSGTVRVPV